MPAQPQSPGLIPACPRHVPGSSLINTGGPEGQGCQPCRRLVPPPTVPKGPSTTEPAQLPRPHGSLPLRIWSPPDQPLEELDEGILPRARSARSPDGVDAQAVGNVPQHLQSPRIRLGFLGGRRSAWVSVCHRYHRGRYLRSKYRSLPEQQMAPSV